MLDPLLKLPTFQVVQSATLSLMTLNTDLIGAAMLRKPIVYYNSESVRARCRAQTGDNIWYPARNGAAWIVDDEEKLASAINNYREELPRLNNLQSQLYPDEKESGTWEENFLKLIKL
jgi:hypothetical protein